MGDPLIDLSLPWPLTGRTDELAAVIEGLAGDDARAVVLGGAAGVGKSRLVAEVLSHLADRDIVVARVTASGSASSIPFGALAPLLPVDDLLADSIVGVLKRAARAIADRGNGKRVVLAVDDAHLLDDASATLIHQLALEGTVRLLLAIRHGEHLSASLASVVHDAATRQVDIRELGRGDIESLTRSVLGGDVDGAALHALWVGSRGNALFLRELLVANIEDGSLQQDRGVWRLHGKPAVPARLVELIESRLANIGDDERIALELISVAHAIGRQALEDAVGTEVVTRLLERGLVTAGRDGRRQPMCVLHPLYEEAIRHRLTSRRMRATQLRLADLVHQLGMRRRDDRLLVTTLRLDAGETLDVDLLEGAALDAYFALDVSLTERLTRAGVAVGAGARLRRMLAEVLRWQGRHEEAESLMAAVPLTDLDERERALSSLVRAENLFRGLGDHDAASRVLADARVKIRDPLWLDEIDAMGAVFSSLSGDLRTGLAEADRIRDRGPSRATAVAATASVAALTFMGRPDEATRRAEEAFAIATELAPQESQAIVATHIMERCLGLIESGHLEEGESIARMSYEWSLASGLLIGQGWFSLLIGRSAQTAGQLDEATRRFRESALVFRDLRDHGIRRWALAGLAQTSAMLGRVADATVALDELDTAPRTAVHLLEAEVLRARAWLAVARGAHSDARRLLSAAIAWSAERGQRGLELTMLHDLVRLGDTRAAAMSAAALGAELEGPLAAARAAHGAAARAQSGTQHDDVATAFEVIGAHLFASEAAAQAAILHRRSGHSSAAAASALRREQLGMHCDDAMTPALRVGGTVDVVQLTARELELATLAADGRSSAEIASQLHISVRTVNNLLQRAYVKLGVSGRRELAERLDQR